MQDRRRIGEAGGLDDHALERQDAVVVALAQQVLERRDQIAAHGAAQAAGGEQHHALVDFFHQQMIEADLAELVDDHHVSCSAGSFRSRFSRVVLPAPRKPVRMVSGMGAGGVIGIVMGSIRNRHQGCILQAALFQENVGDDGRQHKGAACDLQRRQGLVQDEGR